MIEAVCRDRGARGEQRPGVALLAAAAAGGDTAAAAAAALAPATL